MYSTEFDIAPFSFNEASDELAWEEERGRPAAARARPRPRPPQRPPQRRAPRRPRPPGGFDLASAAAPCNCPAHRSEYVRWVQSALNRVDNAALPVNGVMSPTTRSALRAFQTRLGLPADGIAGPDTEQALRNAQRPGGSVADAAAPSADEPGEVFEFETLEFESGAGSMPTLRKGSRGSAVTDLQRRLGAAGFNPGPVDGIFGSGTDAAVRSFQRARGLSADGIVGPMTWGALLNTTPTTAPPPPSSGGSGAIRYGKGWGGSEGVADAAKAIAASMGIRVTSEKRDLAATIRVGSSTSSDHYTGNTNAFAVDLGVSGTRGDELARAIATRYGIPQSVIGTYTRTTIQVGDRRYSLQLLWKVSGHYDHVHLGIRRA